MYISIRAKTNKDYVMINTLRLRHKDGTTISIDREQTEYTIDENGNLQMEWLKPYLFSVNDCSIFGQEGIPLSVMSEENLEAMIEDTDACFELEDDADEDYVCDLINYAFTM